MSSPLDSRTGARPGPLHRTAATVAVTLALAALVGPGCATKGYVRTQVAESQAATDARLATLQGEVTETRTLAGQAMEKATLAEKLAAGAIEYTVVSSHDLRFAFDDYRLDAEARSVLDDLALRLAGQPRYVLEVRGYADARGEERYNYRLGRERAEEVERYLVARHGVAPARVAVLSFGEEDPVADNGTADGRARNRRVTARLLQVTAQAGDTPVAMAP